MKTPTPLRYAIGFMFCTLGIVAVAEPFLPLNDPADQTTVKNGITIQLVDKPAVASAKKETAAATETKGNAQIDRTNPLKILGTNGSESAGTSGVSATDHANISEAYVPTAETTPPDVSNDLSAHAAMQSKGKMLFLTFDDGPVNGTQNVLRILREEGVPATMFFIGNHVQKRPGLFHLAKSNPELLIANHTYWHAHGHYQRFYSDAWNVLSDIEHAQLTIGGRKYLRLAGRDVWRLPEVRRDDYALSPSVRMREHPKYDAVAKDGFFIFGWDVEWRFDPMTGHPLFGPEALARKIDWIARHHRTKLRGKVILLAHDFMFRTQGEARMLRRFIRLMKQRGWHFATIERYSSRKPDVMRIARYYGHPRRSVLVRNDHAIHPDAGTSANATRSSRNDRNALASLIPQTSNGDGALSPSMRPLHLSRAQWLQIRLNDAVLHYRANEVDRLLRAGAKPNRVDRYGRVAINTAIRANSMVLVRKLLRSGAIPTVKDAMGRDALQTARFYRRGAILSYLTHILHPAQAKRLAAAEQLPQTIRTPNAGASADIPSPASVPAVQPTLHRDPLQILR